MSNETDVERYQAFADGFGALCEEHEVVPACFIVANPDGGIVHGGHPGLSGHMARLLTIGTGFMTLLGQAGALQPPAPAPEPPPAPTTGLHLPNGSRRAHPADGA